MREGQIILRLHEIGAKPQRLVVMANRSVILACIAKQVRQLLVSKRQSGIELEAVFVAATSLIEPVLPHQYTRQITLGIRIFRIQRKRTLIVYHGSLLFL